MGYCCRTARTSGPDYLSLRARYVVWGTAVSAGACLAGSKGPDHPHQADETPYDEQGNQTYDDVLEEGEVV